MTKSILFNVKSTQLVNILNGTQTMLLTKRLPKNFVGWVYLACGKVKPYLNESYATNDDGYTYRDCYYTTESNFEPYRVNGKIVARFWWDGNISGLSNKSTFRYYKNLETSRVIKERIFYNIPIRNLEIFDKPRNINEFWDLNLESHYPLFRLPNNWRYVWNREE